MKAKQTTAPDATAPVVLDLGADLSPALKAIETAYRMIQTRFHSEDGTSQCPNVTIVIKRDERAWGHTTVQKVWQAQSDTDATRFEIMISGENLRRGATAVAATLLHEAAHARNLHNGILDTDSNGRHSRKFATTAEEHGLTVTQQGWHGWTGTELGDEAAATWKRMIATIERGLLKSAAVAETPVLPGITGPTATGTEEGDEEGTATPRKRGDRNLIKATCPVCKASIRASRGVLETCNPTCFKCNMFFKLA